MAKEFLEVKCREEGRDYFQTVEGVSIGPLFVHKSLLKHPTVKPLWTVTHCQTGYNIVFTLKTTNIYGVLGLTR